MSDESIVCIYSVIIHGSGRIPVQMRNKILEYMMMALRGMIGFMILFFT
jgi:hypothetical protein